jgi:hypothetical protein
MSALSIQPTYPIFTDIDGQPLEDGYVWIGTANLDPQTNPINVYWDAALTLPAAQPIRTLAGYPANSGTPARLYVDSDYSIRVMNKNGSSVYSAPAATERYSDAVISSLNAGQIAYDESATYPVATVGSSLQHREVVITDAPYNASPSALPSVNRAAIQAAIDACPQGGTVLIPNGTFEIDDELIIDKAMTIRGLGPGKFMESLGGSIIKQMNNAKNAFTLRASLAQWAFGQYGLNNVNFENFAIEGPSGYPAAKDYAPRGIGCDTTVNGGNYHIREFTFTNMEVRFFSTGIELIGICYLNDFYGGVIAFCDTGFALYRGLAPDRGGQTRFFGTTIDLITDACIRWNTDTSSGDLSLFGCTLADAQYGVVANEEASLMISGCSFENLTKPGNLGAGIYIEIKEANPSSDSAKTIVGNKFLLSDCDIWIDCTNASTSAGQFNWPMLIDGNVLLSTEALRISMPIGARPMSSSQFVLGAANSGLNAGLLSPAQISSNFAGNFTFNRVVRRRYAVGVGAPSTIDQLPPGMVVTRARIYLTANATSFTQLFFGDAANNSRYASFDATTQPLNTWVDWTPPVPEFTAGTSLECQLICSGTAGFQGFVGVAEIEGYIDYKL